jgi:hypothetical protein
MVCFWCGSSVAVAGQEASQSLCADHCPAGSNSQDLWIGVSRDQLLLTS